MLIANMDSLYIYFLFSIVPSPTVEVSFASPPTIAYAGNSFTLNCTIMLMEGITDSDLRVNSTWTRNGVMFTDGSRITVNETSSLSGITFFNMLVFSSLSTRDNGTYECVVTLSSPHEFVAGAMVSDSISLDVEGMPIKLMFKIRVGLVVVPDLKIWLRMSTLM